MKDKKVIDWIDSAKGLGVILVILGHFLGDSQFVFFNHFIYSFHVAFFFMLSGFIQSGKKNGALLKKTKRILLPFLAFTLLSAPLFGFLSLKKGMSPLQILMNLFYVKGELFNAPIWFLAVLAEIRLLCGMLKLSERSAPVQLVSWGVSLAAGWLAYRYTTEESLLNLFGFNRMLVSLSFYLFGMCLQRGWNVFDSLKNGTFRPTNEKLLSDPRFLVGYQMGTFVAAAALNIVFGVMINTNVSISAMHLGSYLPFQVAAVCGSIAAMMICRRFCDRKGYLAKLSRYSILFLGTQYFVLAVFKILMAKFSLTGTFVYDAIMIPTIVLYIIFTLKAYEWIKKRFKSISILNGELI